MEGYSNLGKLRVFVLSDVLLHRRSLTISLSREPFITVVGCGDTSNITLCELVDVDVVILDITRANIFDVAKSMGQLIPGLKIVAVAVRETLDEVLCCIEAGIASYVPFEGSSADVISAVERAMRGEFHCPPHIAFSLFRKLAARSVEAQQHPVAADKADLTQREEQILSLLERGMSNKEIARILGISFITVKNHVHNILDKFKVHRRGEAVAQFHASRHQM
jgi:DNA-binding NarL/FixJ family response regulator